jgi:hypothetical protein
VESVAGNNPPFSNGVVRTPWMEWINQANAENWLVALLRLSPENQAIFNETAAIEFFYENEGLPYGFHNFLFGWIDTPDDNFPPPVNAQIFPMIFQMMDIIDKPLSTKMWGEALNKSMKVLKIFLIFV